MAERVHYELDLPDGTGGWRLVEAEPFTRFYEFPVEQAAVDKALANGGRDSGYRVRRVVVTDEVVAEVAPRA